jgi:aerobic carbon-monoxide dehydrogenase small subunit
MVRITVVSDTVRISLTVNDEQVSSAVEPRMSLVDMLRHELHLTGSHVGCEMGACGACLLLLDGTVVHGCLTLAVEADGREIVTIEGLSDSGKISDLQAAFYQRNAVQCGFCTPGMLMTAQELLAQDENPSREKIREALSGNYCRCTGYEAIVDAIEDTAKHRRQMRTCGL